MNVSSEYKPPVSPPREDDTKRKPRERKKESPGKSSGKPEEKNGIKPEDGLRLRRRPNTPSITEEPVPSKKTPMPERITENMQIKPMQDEVSKE